MTSPGPLAGLRVLEMGGVGPVPFTGMLLSDLGADVVRIVRPNRGEMFPDDVNATSRGRTTVEADAKDETSKQAICAMASVADVLLEGFRPGVMERLGLGPDELLILNSRLVYGRMTGYGQTGPLAAMAGHDINYISIAGVLGSIRSADGAPVAPLNLLADYGGGGMLLAVGVLSAAIHALVTGQGQVVDAAMIDGASLLATFIHGLQGHGLWSREPGTNLIDGGAPFYGVYETADGRYVSVGAVEPDFYAELLSRLGLRGEDFPQWDRERWPRFKRHFATVFRSRTRDDWTATFATSDACMTPVLDLGEAASHPHAIHRHSFQPCDGALVPAPAPRFAGTPTAPRKGCTTTVDVVLRRWRDRPADDGGPVR